MEELKPSKTQKKKRGGKSKKFYKKNRQINDKTNEYSRFTRAYKRRNDKKQGNKVL